MADPTIPYPPVFHDWRAGRDLRVSTGQSGTGVEVQTYDGAEPHVWRSVELTEDDAVLLAASLLRRAERDDLADYVLTHALDAKQGRDDG